MKKKLLQLSLKQLEDLVVDFGEPKFRARQIYEGLLLGKSFEEMNISKILQAKLIENCIGLPTKCVKEQKSVDGTIKWAFELSDGGVVEAVLMRYKYGNTICISTQVGCRMGCKFCASSINGLSRNLADDEMLGQVLYANGYLGATIKNRKITNIVLMGCGEPLDNYDNVTKFIDMVSNENGINISQRNISISTCGIVPNIYKLADDGYKINLTISLHAPNDKIRVQIMPIAKKYALSDLIKACDYYFEHTHRRIYFEYTLCSGINDINECANELITLLKGKVCHVNIINLNNVIERGLKSTSKLVTNEFCKKLVNGGLSATVRRELGTDIDGACGQLRMKVCRQD